MVKKLVAVCGLVIYLAALPATSQAQDAKTFLSTVAKAMGAENVKSLQYAGSGSTAATGQPLVYMKSYKCDLDLNAGNARIQIDDKPPLNAGPNAAWDTQYRYWLNPAGFLRGAMSHESTLKAETVAGQKFNVISFMIQGKQVNGYVNDQNLIERVETRIGNDVLAEGVYLYYKDFNGLKFPTTIIEKQNQENTMILIVDSVKPNSAGE